MSLIKTPSLPVKFSDDLLVWFQRHGRTHLPWKRDQDPYAIWVSEIMLQQTQVATVINYFVRFIASFPDVRTLAQASQEQVLQHWAGLGYYARGRNLHKAAKLVVSEHNGKMPHNLEQLQSLPGIGRSTAAAILAQAFDQRHAILDGNVKRVLARLFRVPGYPGKASVQKVLWQYAEKLTPEDKVADYTQAIMDLGATICLRNKPVCSMCPVQTHCQAFLEGDVANFPERKPKASRRKRSAQFLLIENGFKELWLQARPPSGIWGGLTCLVEIEPNEHASRWVVENLGFEVEEGRRWDSFIHKFTHYDLEIQPVLLSLKQPNATNIRESNQGRWYDKTNICQVGLPAPIQKLVEIYLHEY